MLARPQLTTQPTVPPVGVFLVAGCGADLLINICLCLLALFPGHIHAFYVEFVYLRRRDQARQGILDSTPVPGVFSEKVYNGGTKRVHIVAQPIVAAEVPVHAQQQQQGYVVKQR
ncbi:plasma membrane proteolipid 3 [Pyrenophora seminiperda CCB06]|uniref:Plasma membrane proteolipid 3 n=1 Tax=Pyrenophora seminiperda CCB06 TaxID=1302712 RepID=A0A3M7M0V7_9PLEO|nr:plasma membrane proteolipid 3 [Pyrenophora seminiperda CCB06]